MLKCLNIFSDHNIGEHVVMAFRDSRMYLWRNRMHDVSLLMFLRAKISDILKKNDKDVREKRLSKNSVVLNFNLIYQYEAIITMSGDDTT